MRDRRAAQGLKDVSKRARGVVLETRAVILRTISQMYMAFNRRTSEVIERSRNIFQHDFHLYIFFVLTGG
jgi:hypothetical protein